MNLKLLELFDLYQLSHKERYEFMQIYNLLSPDKKVRALERFEVIMQELETLKKELIYEQEILLWGTLESIEEKIYRLKKETLTKNTHNEVKNLKNNLLYY